MSSLLSERKHKPMLSTLFPHQAIPSSSSSSWWWTSDPSELSLATKMQDLASNGQLGELADLLREHHNKLYFPYATMHSSLLHCASLRGQLAVVLLLLNQKHDVDCGSRFDACTPLHVALMRDHSDVALELVLHGAHVTADNIAVAVQWNSMRSLQVLHLANRLPDLRASQQMAHALGHFELAASLGRMQQLSRIEFAAEAMQPRALQHLLDTGGLCALPELASAIALLSRTPLKRKRPGREFKECKDALFAARRRAQEMFVLFLRFESNSGGGGGSGGRRLLVLQVPTMLPTLCEFLGLKKRV